MNIIQNWLRNKVFVRIATLIIIVVLLISIRSMLQLLLFTFIIVFLIGRAQQILKRKLRINSTFGLVVIYIALLSLIGFVGYLYIPVIMIEVTELVQRLMYFYKHPPDNTFVTYIVDNLKRVKSPENTQQNIDLAYGYLSNIGRVSTQLFLALLLSLFFLLGKSPIRRLFIQLEQSKLGRFFQEIEYLGRKFVNSFGKVIEVQFIIAFVNSVLSVIVLWILGFPNLLALGVMVFVLGLIPVLGLLVSLIPLCTIAYSLGGGIKVLSILIMVVVLHALESYVLNPKLMSSKTNLPAFITFIILIFGEHFLGIWGLVLGIPIFIFFLDLIGIDADKSSKIK
ncbi:AI-2E family transporter [Priestia megaterium]|uniref:AI-2E family transporter n=1 Tax=Priestia megaterium TaxID=1404 RepID=UPI002A6A8F1D|nr:AI-2E family transporter [Priestia megaterium]MDY0944050.1 AI-2E family transporter [Priestia megaterium]